MFQPRMDTSKLLCRNSLPSIDGASDECVELTVHSLSFEQDSSMQLLREEVCEVGGNQQGGDSNMGGGSFDFGKSSGSSFGGGFGEIFLICYLISTNL